MKMGLDKIPRTLPPPKYRLLYNNCILDLVGQIIQEVIIMNTNALIEQCIQTIIELIFKDFLDRKYKIPLHPIMQAI